MVRIHPDPPTLWRLNTGGVAQLGEHLLCKQGVIGSIPFTSTKSREFCACAGRGKKCVMCDEWAVVILLSHHLLPGEIGCSLTNWRSKV
jgi:hypothetical protein